MLLRSNFIRFYFAYYNFSKIHPSLRVTPAMEAGISGSHLELDGTAHGLKYFLLMKARFHPVGILLSILLASIMIGVFGSRYFYHRYERQFVERYGTAGAAGEIGDSGYLFLLIGVGLGLLIGLAVGISAYVAIRHRASDEQSTVLNLTKPDSPATH